MKGRADLLIVAVVMMPFVALGAMLYALVPGLVSVWRLSRRQARWLTLVALVEHVRRELDEERDARRDLAGKAWRDPSDCPGWDAERPAPSDANDTEVSP